jgi:RNA polymerase sigma-70 factor (ECF subfamily)
MLIMESRAEHTAPVVDLGSWRRHPRPSTADELLARVAKGDRDAFEALYELLIDRVYGLIRSVLRDPAQSEEVAQEVMVELWRIAPRWQRSSGAATSWVLMVAHRRAVDRVRSVEASRRRDEQHASSVDRSGPDTATTVLDHIDAETVRAAMDELTPVQREAIELAYFGGRTHSEVAALLDLPIGTVKTRIRDGLIRLRDRMGVAP